MLRRYAKIEHEIFFGQAVDAIFEVFDPCAEVSTPLRRRARHLMSKVGRNVAIGENNVARIESGDDRASVLEAVAGIQQGGEVRVMVRPEIAVEKLADHFAKPGFVLRKTGGEDAVAPGFESLGEKADLSLFAAAVDTFHGDELSASGHEMKARR